MLRLVSFGRTVKRVRPVGELLIREEEVGSIRVLCERKKEKEEGRRREKKGGEEGRKTIVTPFEVR